MTDQCCMACGLLNPLERCHVIPRRFLRAIIDRNSLQQRHIEWSREFFSERE